MTQKQELGHLRTLAAKLDHTISIRKNAHGEYELRVRGESQAHYFASDWKDAVDTAYAIFKSVEATQDRKRREADAAYEYELREAIFHVSSLLRAVQCEVRRHGDYVNFWSPWTGSHTLTMRRGVRPVSNLYAHAAGFAEQQLHHIQANDPKSNERGIEQSL